MFTICEIVLPVYDNGQDTRYKRLYLKSEFNFNVSNISHHGYFTDKQNERLCMHTHIRKTKGVRFVSQKSYIYIAHISIS